MPTEQRAARPRSLSAPATVAPQVKVAVSRTRRLSFGSESEIAIERIPGSHRALWHTPAALITSPSSVSSTRQSKALKGLGKSVETSSIDNTPSTNQTKNAKCPERPEGEETSRISDNSSKVQTQLIKPASTGEEATIEVDDNKYPKKSRNTKELYAGIVDPEPRRIRKDRFVVRGNRSVAVDEAHEVLKRARERWNQGRILSIFGDCSAILNTRHTVPMTGAYAVTQPNHRGERGSFVISTWKMKKLHEATNGELLAVVEGLNIVKYLRELKSLRLWSDRSATLEVHIFTDSQHSLNLARSGQNLNAFDNLETVLAQPIVAKIIELVHELESTEFNCRIHFHWIPGHEHDVKPHVMADAYSRMTAKDKCPEFLAEILRCGRDGAAPYRPIGPELQKKVLALALRHPAFDQHGVALSERGKGIAAEKASKQTPYITAPAQPWLEELSATKKASLTEMASTILSSCSGKKEGSSTDETNPPPRPLGKRKTADSGAEGSHQEVPVAKRAKTTMGVPPEIAKLMAREFKRLS